MDTISTSDSQSKLSLLQLARSTGPGIMMATAAVVALIWSRLPKLAPPMAGKSR